MWILFLLENVCFVYERFDVEFGGTSVHAEGKGVGCIRTVHASDTVDWPDRLCPNSSGIPVRFPVFRCVGCSSPMLFMK